MLSPLARKMAQMAMCQRTSWERVSEVGMGTLYRIDSTSIESIRRPGHGAGTIGP